MTSRKGVTFGGRRVAGTDETGREPGAATPGTRAESGETARERVESSFARAENEDDDGYDPWSDRPPTPEPLFERDPWS